MVLEMRPARPNQDWFASCVVKDLRLDLAVSAQRRMGDQEGHQIPAEPADPELCRRHEGLQSGAAACDRHCVVGR